MLPPGKRQIEVLLAGSEGGKPVAFNGKPVEVAL